MEKKNSQRFCLVSNDKLGAEKSVTKLFIGEKKMERKMDK